MTGLYRITPVVATSGALLIENIISENEGKLKFSVDSLLYRDIVGYSQIVEIDIKLNFLIILAFFKEESFWPTKLGVCKYELACPGSRFLLINYKFSLVNS